MKIPWKNRSSIEARLLLRLTPPLVIICIITLIITPKLVTNIAYRVFDRSLFSIALQLEEHMFFKKDTVGLDLNYFNFIFPESKSGDSIYYKITDPKGRVVIGFKDLPSPDAGGFVKKSFFFDDQYKGKKTRGVLYRTRLNSSTLEGFVEIVVAETTNERDLVLFKTIYTILALILFMFLVSAGIAIVGIRQGIKPLKNLQKKISRQSVDNLKKITIDVPLEVESLVLSINSLIKRVRTGLSHIQYFNADVSHQLRTPLAEMSALIEITQKDNEMETIQANLARMKTLNLYMSHTVQQLLMYAKVQRNSADISNFAPIDIGELVKEYCALSAPGIYRNNQTISLHKEEKPIMISGDNILLTGMLQNIIDNAKKYAVCSQGRPAGDINVSVISDSRDCTIRICDQGPGIDEKFIKKAFDRFERKEEDTTFQGFGFGLAIVKEVILLHSGTVLLENRSPSGLCLTIKLPLS